jgi:ubiquinone/menaquinone biosynthesis C-methylase UbiE
VPFPRTTPRTIPWPSQPLVRSNADPHRATGRALIHPDAVRARSATPFISGYHANRLALFFTFIAVLLIGAFSATSLARADAVSEIDRLAALMQWKEGTVVADIGAGDGSYSFAAARHVGESGKVIATEIDSRKIAELRAEIKRRNLHNVVVEHSKEVDTALPPSCCDAMFLRRVYHHLTKPAEFDTSLVRSLKPGGRLAIIDFPARSGLEPVEGVPANRGGHGIPQEVVIEELTAAGLRVEKIVTDWPSNSYCVLFMKK